MSTTSDILDRATELTVALAELLDTDTAEALPEVARQLGVVELLNSAIDLLGAGLTQLRQSLASLEGALVHLEALGGLFGLLEPLVGALADMIGASGQGLAEIGLGDAVDITGPIAGGVAYVEHALQVGSNLTVDRQSFAHFEEAIGDLRIELLELRVDETAQLTLAQEASA